MKAESRRMRPRFRVMLVVCVVLLALAAGAYYRMWQQRMSAAASAPAVPPPRDPMEFVLSEDSCIAGQWFESPTETAVAASRMVAQAVADAKQNPWPPFVTDAGPTTAERVERAFDALEQLYTESYAACGNRNPTWDNAAVNRLRQAANWVAHHSTDRVATKALLTEFGKLEKLDCTDPLIVYWQGNLRFHVNGAADATPYLRRALAGFDESNYPRMMLFYATRRLAAALAAQRGFEDPEVQHLRKRMFTHFGEAAGDTFVREDRGRDLYHWEYRHLIQQRQKPHEMTDTAVAAAALVDPDPWAAALARHMHHFETAWRARGAGWADTVTAEGGRIFSTELDKDYQLCLQAWESAPDRPEFAAMLLQISRPTRSKDEEMLWFQRCVQAQFDYPDAYSHMLMSLMPRWCGSLSQLVAFEEAMRRTQRTVRRRPSRPEDEGLGLVLLRRYA